MLFLTPSSHCYHIKGRDAGLGEEGGGGISGFYILYPLSCLLPNLIYVSNLFYLHENNLER
jgi:hypothetical protein